MSIISSNMKLLITSHINYVALIAFASWPKTYEKITKTNVTGRGVFKPLSNI